MSFNRAQVSFFQEKAEDPLAGCSNWVKIANLKEMLQILHMMSFKRTQIYLQNLAATCSDFKWLGELRKGRSRFTHRTLKWRTWRCFLLLRGLNWIETFKIFGLGELQKGPSFLLSQSKLNSEMGPCARIMRAGSNWLIKQYGYYQG